MITLTSLTLGEILQKAGLNTLLGMGVVFTVLILISLLIYCLRFIPVFFEKMAGKKEEEKTAAPVPTGKKSEPAAAPKAVQPAAPAAGGEEDLALIAVITAAIAAQANVPADGIVIRSIRRSTKNNWKHA